MIVLGVDLETTGLDVGQCEIIEIGAVLWDWRRHRPVKIFSELIHCEVPIPTEISALTGIDAQDVELWGVPLLDGLVAVHDLAQQAQFLVGHNGLQFDRLFFERAWIQHPSTRVHLEWIDTTCDLPLAKSIQTRKLSYLAAEMGFLNPFAHRSLFDVLTMLKVLSRFEPDEVLRMQSSPLKRIVAQVSYEDRELAKGQGFRWDPKQKHWYLEGKECVLVDREYPFPTLVL